jgi:RNA polymerase sigma factor (sigma-70 family)
MQEDGTRPLLAAFEAHYDELTAFVRRRVNCPALAADIVQEVYVRLAGGSAPGIVRNPRAFLYRVAGNLAIDHLRQNRARARYIIPSPPSEDVQSPEPSADMVVQSREEIAILQRTVLELPEKCREAFLLYKGHGLSMKAVAEILHLSPKTVEKHIAKAMVHCRLRLREAGRHV